MQKNVIVNLIGQILVGLMTIIFVPIYVKYLGQEGYGLISFFVVIQAFLNLLDMGLTATLGKELAKYTGGSYTKSTIRDLIRTYEILALVIIGMGFLLIASLSNFIAEYWLKGNSISKDSIQQAIILMGLLFSARFLEGIYRGIIIGLQEHVTYNIMNMLFSTLKWAGVIVILEYFGGTAKVFLAWQILITMLVIIVFRKYVNLKIPNPTLNPKFDKIHIYRNWQFTRGMALITLTVFAITNIDKIIVSNYLNLSNFGIYNLILTMAAMISMLTAPITQTLLPKLTQNIAEKNFNEYQRNFNIGSQLIVSSVGVIGILIAFYPEEVFYIWTGNRQLASEIFIYLRIYCIGTLFNCLLVMPYLAQLAKEQTQLTVKINMASVIILTPALLYFVPKFGLIAAVSVWCVYALASFIITPRFAFKNIEIIKLSNWYKYDVFIPLALPICVLTASKFISIDFNNKLHTLSYLVLLGVLTMIIAVISCGLLREILSEKIKKIFH